MALFVTSIRPLEVCFRHRSSLVLALVWPVAAAAVAPRLPSRTEVVLGTAAVAAGAALRLEALRVLGRGARVHCAGLRQGLATDGPYAFTRNPLYLAAAIALAGLDLTAGSGWSALLLIPAAILVYTPVVVHEEAVLRAAAPGRYARYARAAPRWIGVPSRCEQVAAHRTPWREILRRETLLLPGLAAALAAIAAVQTELLPLRSMLAAIAYEVGLSGEAILALALLLAAAGNSWAIERKLRRRIPASEADRPRAARAP